MIKIGVLVSGSGTNLQSIIDASLMKRIDVEIGVVISNRPKAMALKRAIQAEIPTEVVLPRAFETREFFEGEMVRILREHNVKWVVLAGFMRTLTAYFTNAFKDRIINIHPSLLPSFPGVRAQKQAIEYGVRFSGCTVHFVDEGTDTGPIIAQAVVPVLDRDGVEALTERILEQEHWLYPRVLQLIAEGRVIKEEGRVRVVGEI
jgi:phosphoribosylglycinamide formyltransferase-1